MSKSKLARTILSLAPTLAITVLVHVGFDHDDAHAFVSVGTPIVTALWRRWRARRRSDE